MASTSAAYRETADSANQKWPRDLAPWFEASDLPDNLRSTILVMLRKDRHGNQLWMCITRLAVEMGVCRRTAQRRVHRLRDMGVLRRIYRANCYPFPDTRPDYFRPSATYEAHPEVVKPKPTWKDFEKMRATERRLRVKSATQHWRRWNSRHSSSSSAATVTPISPPLAPAPEAAAAVEHYAQRASPPRIRDLRSHEATKLIALVKERMRGCRGSVNTEQGLMHIDAGHPSFRAPMSLDDALISACLTLGLNPDQANAFLKRFPQHLVEDAERER